MLDTGNDNSVSQHLARSSPYKTLCTEPCYLPDMSLLLLPAERTFSVGVLLFAT